MIDGLHANRKVALRDYKCMETSEEAVNTTIEVISKTKKLSLREEDRP